MNSLTNNSVVKSITNALTEDLTPLPELTQSISGNTSSGTSWFNWQTVIIIILILALLGLNIFVYLAKGTSDIATLLRDIFGPILSFFGVATVDVANTAVQGAAQGTAAIAQGLANTSQSAANTIKGVDSKTIISGSQQIDMNTQFKAPTQDQLKDALNDNNTNYNGEVMPDDSYSSAIQRGTSGKAGWCYIGEEKGVRTCAKVGVNDTCMSGDIFPSQEICVNPSLRP